ncbi:unnamed protein product [Macrosiphum euphorbiae]|uniref:Uncharacterized protein n=1 Tax=Macrosiphum euphorbiae TaxID=13131 RepID=A0AAV0XYQ7_9HEMI|nr:unnamed protein product [Macrosiphum euphorbiae]
MPTNGHDNIDVADLPPTASEMTTDSNNNNQGGGLFETIFCIMVFNAILEYSRKFPKSLRKVIEFVLLLQAVLSFVVLVYLHINFSRMQANCLGHVKDVWPRDGILRVEIIRNFQHSHAEQTGTMNELLGKSYEREYKLKHMGEENAKLFNRFTKTNSPEKKGDIDIEQSTEKLVENKSGETNTKLFNYLSFTDYTYFEGKIYSK